MAQKEVVKNDSLAIKGYTHIYIVIPKGEIQLYFFLNTIESQA